MIPRLISKKRKLQTMARFFIPKIVQIQILRVINCLVIRRSRNRRGITTLSLKFHLSVAAGQEKKEKKKRKPNKVCYGFNFESRRIVHRATPGQTEEGRKTERARKREKEKERKGWKTFIIAVRFIGLQNFQSCFWITEA